MDGGHQSLLNSELVVEDLGQRSEAVCGARSVGDCRSTNEECQRIIDNAKQGRDVVRLLTDILLGVVLVQVDSAYEHGSIS